MTDEQIILCGVLTILGILASLARYLINDRYTRFVKEHSLSYREIEQINERYSFSRIPNFDMTNSYDNQAFYNDISTTDYLIYQLVYNRKEIAQAIKNAGENLIKYTVLVSLVKSLET